MDDCEDFKRFFKGLTDRPRLKSRRRSKTSFYNDNIKQKVKANMFLIEKVGGLEQSNKYQLVLSIRIQE